MNNVQNEGLGGEVGREMVNVCWTEVLREALMCYDFTASFWHSTLGVTEILAPDAIVI